MHNDELLTQLTTAGTLRHLDTDTADAHALAIIARNLLAARQQLINEGVGKKAVAAFDSKVINRAGRLVTEQLWEHPRRKTAGKPALSNKFVVGGLWGPEARALVFNPDGTVRDPSVWQNQVLLEHVVPANTVTRIIGNPATVNLADTMRQIVMHTVLSKTEDAMLGSKNYPADVEQQLIDHYTGTTVLDQAAVNRLLWHRYLGVPFLGDLRVIEQDDR